MNSLLDTLRISLAGLALGTLALGGCGECENSKQADDDSATAVVEEHAGHDHGEGEHKEARVDVYVGILGKLAFVPEAGDTKLHPKIRHMQIPTFKKADGTIPMSRDGYPGMKSMEMEFPLAKGVSLEGFEAGDKVRFSFEVTWGESTSWVLTGVEKLDPSTVIDYTNKAP